jgi:hypothetical protein
VPAMTSVELARRLMDAVNAAEVDDISEVAEAAFTLLAKVMSGLDEAEREGRLLKVEAGGLRAAVELFHGPCRGMEVTVGTRH